VRKKDYGGILTDTLVVVAAIALLTAIAIPVYLNRDERAKIDQATAEIESLALAQIAAAEAHGFYVPLQMLDDLAVREASRSSRTDDIGNEPKSIRLIDPANPSGTQLLLTADNPRVKDLLANWKGPFYESKRVYMTTSDGSIYPEKADGAAIMRDYPLDPWGTPYRFYSPSGMIGSSATSESPADLDSDAFSDGAITTHDDRFDSFAIVSFGPDGKSASAVSNPEQQNDDIIYLFETGAPGA
jgi:type II secretory pathway pseudopilin PulG